MPEYIVKEQALESILSAIDLTGEQWAQVWNKIKQTPPADVAPVVYAEWVGISEPDENDEVMATCSNCGSEERFWKVIKVPFCWHCGAKMKIPDSIDPAKAFPERIIDDFEKRNKHISQEVLDKIRKVVKEHD